MGDAEAAAAGKEDALLHAYLQAVRAKSAPQYDQRALAAINGRLDEHRARQR